MHLGAKWRGTETDPLGQRGSGSGVLEVAGGNSARTCLGGQPLVPGVALQSGSEAKVHTSQPKRVLCMTAVWMSWLLIMRKKNKKTSRISYRCPYKSKLSFKCFLLTLCCFASTPRNGRT